MIPEATSKVLTASGLVTKGRAKILGMLIGMDGVNDPTITVYDGLDNSGEVKIPTSTYDASALGLNGVEKSYLLRCATGIYVEISGLGSGEVVIYYTEG